MVLFCLQCSVEESITKYQIHAPIIHFFFLFEFDSLVIKRWSTSVVNFKVLFCKTQVKSSRIVFECCDHFSGYIFLFVLCKIIIYFMN